MPGMDQIVKSEPQRHVLVIHRGKLFAVDAFDEYWRIRPENEIMGDVAAILDNDKDERDLSVCPLTTLDR